MLGPKTASDSELSRGVVNPVIYLIFARYSVILVCCPLSRQVELTMHRVKISYLCLSVEMAGSNTKGTRKRKAKTLTIQAVPRNKDV